MPKNESRNEIDRSRRIAAELAALVDVKKDQDAQLATLLSEHAASGTDPACVVVAPVIARLFDTITKPSEPQLPHGPLAHFALRA